MVTSMKLRHLRIRCFRGIKELDWRLPGDFLCLVGPGDSCKSTILDAVELVLSPRWNPNFEDSDFYDGDVARSIVISATLGELPRWMLSEAHFGLRLRGMAPSGEIHDEPEEGDEEVLTVSLSVDSSLEPSWEVVTDRHPEGAKINAREREKLGAVRLGPPFERHLSWAKGSMLARLGGDQDEHAEMLADANRRARNAVDKSKLPKLSATAQVVAQLASSFGVKPRLSFVPALDPGANAVGAGGLALHDGPVPLRRAGLGTRRLVALAMQRHVAREGGVILVDELENALEPYRVRRLTRELLAPSVLGDIEADEEEPSGPRDRKGVVLMTSHSPIVLAELEARHLCIVRTTAEGVTTILPLGDSLQPLLRDHPEAFLSRKVIVCEGKTELGLLKGLDEAWSQKNQPFAFEGVSLVHAGGRTKVGKVAQSFRSLGYEVAVLADSDEPLDVTPQELSSCGVAVTCWSSTVSTEQRIFLDLPREGVECAIYFAFKNIGETTVRSQLCSALKMSTKELPQEVEDWLVFKPEVEVRDAMGQAAKAKNGWFKSVPHACDLGIVIAGYLDQIEEKDLASKLFGMRNWIFNER